MSPDDLTAHFVTAQAGLDTLIPQAGSELLGQGLIGAFCIFLIWVLGRRDQELKDEREAHKAEMAEMAKQMLELQESRLEELKQVVQQVGSNTQALAANKQATENLLPLLNRILDALNNGRSRP
jgi:hypothetical protein